MNLHLPLILISIYKLLQESFLPSLTLLNGPCFFFPSLPTGFACSQKSPLTHCTLPPSLLIWISLPAPFPLSASGIENGITSRKCFPKLGRARNVYGMGIHQGGFQTRCESFALVFILFRKSSDKIRILPLWK